MKKLEVSEEFVKEAHASACKEWKKRIEREFPSLFEIKPIIGKWFKRKDGDIESKFMGLIAEGDLGGKIKGYGINSLGKWVDHDFYLFGSNWNVYTEATSQEIESMLWKEAENRGIGEDTKINSVKHISYELHINDGTYSVGYFEHDDLLANKNGVVYYKGEWATPLDENKEIKETISRLEKELKELKEKVK